MAEFVCPICGHTKFDQEKAYIKKGLYYGEWVDQYICLGCSGVFRDKAKATASKPNHNPK